MDGYEKRSFEAPLRDATPIAHDVYERGDGPPVVLIQEMPGIGKSTLELADRLVHAGHRVVMPHLFGPLGRVSLLGNTARVLCMRRELTLFSRKSSSPMVDWLRALCRDVRERLDVPGVGVIGMCLTGNFAITLIADDSVLAAVASQPSMPVIPQTALQMSAEEIARSREALDRKGPMLALHFAGDVLCSKTKFRAIDAAFNDDRQRIEMHELPGFGHSVLTLDFVDRHGHPTQAAMQRVLAYLGEALGATPGDDPGRQDASVR